MGDGVVAIGAGSEGFEGGTAARFEWLLSELGWTKAAFARKAGLVPETVSRWVEPPAWAIQWLEAERMALGMRTICAVVTMLSSPS